MDSFWKKNCIWLENHDKRDKTEAIFRKHHSNINHLVTLRIIAEEFHNSKYDLFYCFVDFRKAFNMVLRDKLRQKLEEIIVPLELRVVVIHLYGNVITKLKTTEGCAKEIKCNIGVKQGCPLSPPLFGIYITKLEVCLEDVGYDGTKLVDMVITLLLYCNTPLFL